MRHINKVIIHCSATPEGRAISVDTIRQWHIKRGWSDIGYHYVILINGTIQEGRPVERAGAHCKGHNANSIGVCFEGGKLSNGDKWMCPLLPQMQSYTKLKNYLFAIYGDLKVSGHYEYSSKTCPNFNIDLLEQ